MAKLICLSSKSLEKVSDWAACNEYKDELADAYLSYCSAAGAIMDINPWGIFGNDESGEDSRSDLWTARSAVFDARDRIGRLILLRLAKEPKP